VPVGCTPHALHSADVTGDGRPDLIVGCVEKEGSAYVLKNQYGSGGIAAFASPVPLFSADVPGPVALAAADWNADGHLDVALLSSRSASLQIFLNQGDGSFVGGAAQRSGQTPTSLLALDANQDGRLDLVIADAGKDAIGVLLADGAGRFLPIAPIDLGYTPGAVAALDWNGDGMADLAIANRDRPEVGLQLASGGGSFQSTPAIATSDPIDVLLAYFPEGSGASALAAVGHRSRRISVFRKGISQSSPNSLSEQLYATRPAPRAPLAADLTNDGRIDVAWVEGERITILPAVGDGSFEPAQSLYTLSLPTALASGDWNSDQLADVAATTAAGLSVFLSRGPGQLQAAVDIAAPAPLTRVLSADLDLDGRLDLISSSASFTLRIQFGNGNGTFRPGLDVDMGGAARALAVVDLDGDDRRDLVVMTDSDVRARLGLLGGGFGELKVHGAFARLSAMAVADMNLDGVRDLVLGDEGGRVFLLRGRGEGSFAQAQSVVTSGPVRYLVVLDLDRDGNLDAALAEEGRSLVRVLLGKPDGTLQPPLELSAELPASGLLHLDLDGDHFSELLVPSALGYSVLRNRTQQ
jgi:hypothetical protein